MLALIESYKRTQALHHAYLVLGERADAISALETFLKNELLVSFKANPDFWKEEFDVFGIDESRALRDKQTRVALSGKKIFIIAARSFTREAQNALLKVFEDPTPNTHFFVVTADGERLLPTLRSRMQTVFIERGNNEHGKEDAKEFVSLAYAARFEHVRAIAEEKDKEKAIKLLDDIMHVLRERLSEGEPSENARKLLEHLFTARSYLGDRSSSIKMLLEYAASILPPPQRRS